MPSTVRKKNRWRLASAVSLFATICVSAGCATPQVPATSADKKPAAVTAHLVPKPIPVVRYGRYSLVEVAPDTAQQNLLLQIMDISMPGTMSATVGDGVRYVLLRSGYQLCKASDVGTLDSLPLPAAHLHLGPMLLGEALQTLAGPAWQLQVDDVERQICFTRAANSASTPMSSSTPSGAHTSMKPESSKASATAKEQP